MKKINQTKLLNFFAIFFVVIIGIGVITMKTNELKYEVSAKETLDRMVSNPVEMTKAEALQLLENPGPDVIFVDIRNKDKFQKGHVENAVHIPAGNLMASETLTFLKDSTKTIVLYGRDKIQAYGPWLLLQQMGMDHIQFIPGSYDELTDVFAFSDTSRYDYQKIFGEAQEAVRSANAEPIPPSKPKKVKLVPKPVKKAAVEEEEGC